MGKCKLKLQWIPPYTQKDDQDVRKINADKDVENLEPTFIAGRNLKWCILVWKTIPQKLNIELPYDSAITLLGIYSDLKHIFTQKLIQDCS